MPDNLIRRKILIVMGPFSGKAWGAGQQDSYNLIKLLTELDCEISLISYDYLTNYEFVNKFKEAGARVFVFPLKTGISISRLLVDSANQPFFKLCENKDFKKLFENIQPETVIGIQTFTFPVLDFARRKNIFTIMRSQNLEYKHYLDMLTKRQFFNSLNYFFYFSKYLSERHSAINSSLVFAISPTELAVYKKWNSHSELLPLCSLYEKIKNPADRLNKVHDKINLFYAGASYNILPHLKGAEFLIEKIMPALESGGYDDFKLHIIGSKLPQKLVNKCDGQRIIYRGYIDNYEAVLEEMDIGVFPVFTGRGMKQKIFEAIARGFPVVAPKKALGGYRLKNQENILFADDCSGFVSNIIKLKDKKERERISYGAYEFAKENFDKDSYVRILKNSLSEII